MISELKITKFGSLEEFIRWTNVAPKHPEPFRNWHGADSYEAAVKIAREGVELGRVKHQLENMEHSRVEMTQVMDVCGSTVNMDAYLSGEPENMFEFPIVEQPTKFLKLFIEVGECSAISVAQMINKAIAIASMVDELENNGYRIALSVGNLSTFDKTFRGQPVSDYTVGLATLITIKDYHQSLSVGQLTGCCHPSFLRVLLFRHFEAMFKNGGGAPNNMGIIARNSKTINQMLEAVADKDILFIPDSLTVKGNLSTVSSAAEMISNLITIQP